MPDHITDGPEFEAPGKPEVDADALYDQQEPDHMSESTHVIEYGITDVALADLKDRLTGIDATKDYEGAKEAIKECRDLRVSLDKKRKELKKDALEYGRRVDGEAKRIRVAIEAVEDPIKETKDSVDKAAERKEAARVEIISNKIAGIKDFGEDLFGLSLDELEQRLDRLSKVVVGEGFEEFFHDANRACNEATDRLRIAIKAARDAKEAADKLAQQRKEQEVERERLEAQRKEQEEAAAALRRQQEKIDANKRAQQAEVDRKQRETQEQLDAVQAELDEQKAAEEEKKREAEAAERAAELRPDKEKLLLWAAIIEEQNSPAVQSDAAQFVIAETRESLSTVAAEVRRSAEELA